MVALECRLPCVDDRADAHGIHGGRYTLPRIEFGIEFGKFLPVGAALEGVGAGLERATLVCSSLGSAGSIALGGRGAPSVVRELPWWDASTPVLHDWRHGVISCSLGGSAILCHNHGSAIRVDRAGFAVAL